MWLKFVTSLKKMGLNAREYVKREHNPEKIALEFSEFLIQMENKGQSNYIKKIALELDEIGTHDVIVSYDGKSIGKFSQQVTEENVREYAGVDILELRLSLLQTLESILEIIFGK